MQTFVGDTKYCSICKVFKKWDEFYLRPTKYSGDKPYGWCKECTKLRTGTHRRKFGQRYIEKERITRKIWKIRNAPKRRYQNLRNEAKRRNLECKLEFEEYINLINKPCYYCSMDLSALQGGSLDRIDNSKGYLIDNVLPCCGICNKTRHDAWTVEETKIMIEAVLIFRKQRDL